MEWVRAQGGDARIVDEPALLPRAPYVATVSAPHGGYIAALDAREVGMAAVALGAGRDKKTDPIDHAVGIVLGPKVGDHVAAGEPLFLFMPVRGSVAVSL